MKILLTNDDGIGAPGLVALHQSALRAFRHLNPEIVVVAPDRGRSECSHSVTSGRSFKMSQIKPGWFSVDGTPVDCVRLGLNTIMPRPNFLLSGVNAGANLGINLMVSGTFAAAREAAVCGVPSMAISHYRRHDVDKTWDHVPEWVHTPLTDFLKTIETRNPTDAEFRPSVWNVNLPAVSPDSVPNVEWCDVDTCPIDRVAKWDGEMVSFELDFHGRPRKEGTDVDRCFAGSITISEVSPLFI